MKDPQRTRDELNRLAAESGWAHGLAVGLVGDAHLAEDVVQDAWVAALERPDAARSRSAWLAGAVRRLALGQRRDRARRTRREEIASREEAQPASADSAARLEQQGILIETLLELEEPFRSALIARHVDGLPPRAIAQRDGVPVATVNSRLARGLTRMRTRLEARHGGDTRSWIAAMAPLLEPPAVSQGSSLVGALLMKKSVAAALIALLAPLVWYVQAPASPLPGEVTLAPNASAVESLREAGPIEAEPDAAKDRIAAAPTKNTSATAPEESDLEESVSVQLLLLDHASRRPIPEAEVWVMGDRAAADLDPLQLRQLLQDMPAGPRRLMIESGRRYRADVDGRVEVQIPLDGGQVYARGEGGHGNERVTASDELQEVLLAPDRQLSVEVVDSMGRAQENVPVSLVSDFQGQALELAQGVTNSSEGEPALAELLLWEGFPAPFLERLYLTLDFPHADPQRVPVQTTHWPVKPIRFELPPVGAVLLEVTSADGQAPNPVRALHLAQRPAEGPAWQVQLGSLSGATESGPVRLWPIGLDLELTASAFASVAGRPAEHHFRGPTQQGQELAVHFSLQENRLAMTGQLHDENGEVLQTTIYLSAGEGWIGQEVESDADGTFEIEWIATNEATIAGPLTIAERHSPYRRATVSLPAQDATQRIELGKVYLERRRMETSGPSLLGRVVNAAGEPVADAQVMWVQPVEGIDGRTEWRNSGSAYAHSAKDGRFEIADVSAETPGTLQAQVHEALHHSPQPLDLLPRGAEGEYLLMLEAGCQLEGELLLDPGVDPRSIHVELWPETAGPAPRRSDIYGWIQAIVDASGSFRFPGVAPGRYTLRGGIGETHQLAQLVTGLDLELDGPPQLLDLRGLFRVLDVRVVDEGGLPVRASVYAFWEGERRGERTILGPEHIGDTSRGPIVLGSEPEHALIIQEYDHFPVLLDPLDVPDEVVLKRGLEVELEWSGADSIADLPGKLEVILVPLSDESQKGRAARYLRLWSPGRVTFQDDGTATSRVPAAGVYRIALELDYEYRPGYHLEAKLNLDGATLSVDGSGGRYSIGFDAALEDAVDELRADFETYVERGHISSEIEFGQMLPN